MNASPVPSVLANVVPRSTEVSGDSPEIIPITVFLFRSPFSARGKGDPFAGRMLIGFRGESVITLEENPQRKRPGSLARNNMDAARLTMLPVLLDRQHTDLFVGQEEVLQVPVQLRSI